jgi:hypothetical protein
MKSKMMLIITLISLTPLNLLANYKAEVQAEMKNIQEYTKELISKMTPLSEAENIKLEREYKLSKTNSREFIKSFHPVKFIMKQTPLLSLKIMETTFPMLSWSNVLDIPLFDIFEINKALFGYISEENISQHTKDRTLKKILISMSAQNTIPHYLQPAITIASLEYATRRDFFPKYKLDIKSLHDNSNLEIEKLHKNSKKFFSFNDMKEEILLAQKLQVELDYLLTKLLLDI